MVLLGQDALSDEGRREAASSRPKTVVFILSTSFAGSHYLSLLLGSHSRTRHLGEVFRLREDKARNQANLCYSCRDKPHCPILSGIAPEHVDQVYDMAFSRFGP